MNPKSSENMELDIQEMFFDDVLQDYGLYHSKIAKSDRPLKRSGYYVRTIPLDWARTAASLPGKAAAVSLALWFIVGIRKSPTVVLSGVLLRCFGIHRLAGRRALEKLEAAGLVRVERTGKKSPRVNLIY